MTAGKDSGNYSCRPLIGLSTHGIAHAEGFSIPAEYVQAVLRAGGLPLLLPAAPVDPVASWIETIKGLVLIGGGDIEPARYGCDVHDTIYKLDTDRDTCDFALARQGLFDRLVTVAGGG